jgi:hypothetical protein
LIANNAVRANSILCAPDHQVPGAESAAQAFSCAKTKSWRTSLVEIIITSIYLYHSLPKLEAKIRNQSKLPQVLTCKNNVDGQLYFEFQDNFRDQNANQQKSKGT